MKTLLTLLLTLTLISAQAQDSLTAAHKEVITDFINDVKWNDREALAKRISFPFKREYPIPSIKNKAEFLKRYDEVFDTKLVGQITKSDPGHDWYAGGYRGIMFSDGQVWLEYHDGSLLAVNYQSAAEAKIKEELIAKDKKSVHPSVSQFTRPVHVLKTAKYLARIDDVGHANYRYTAWNASAKMTDKPNIIITNGEYKPDGSGGNHSYIFKNNGYTYECQIVFVGADDDAPANLIVYKGNQQILFQPAEIIVK
jgi:hypothetical protein